MRRIMLNKVDCNKYNKFLISTKTGIAKDCLSLQWNQCEKISHYIPGHKFQSPSIGRESLQHGGYSSENIPDLHPFLSFHVTTYFLYAHAVYIYSKI